MKLKKRTESIICDLKDKRRKRQQYLALVTALAVFTTGNVFWDLRETGTAITEEQLCTAEAHQHSAECSDPDGKLICGKEEHEHSADCVSDILADVETPGIWEMTFSPPENAPLHERAALIAESQLGYTESSDNFILTEAGIKQGYTRYGEWYGNPYGDWNTMFTYFCLYYAGIGAEEGCYGGNARTWQISLEKDELIRPPDGDMQRGDAVLLDTDGNGEADRTGIISGTGEQLTVIGGDIDDAVAEIEFKPDDPQILGYTAFPEPEIPPAAAPTESPPDSPEAIQVSFSAQSPSGISVSALAEAGAFPEDAVMTVSDVSREEALQAAENLQDDTLDAIAVDITFTDSGGAELEPADNKTVQVQITIPEDMKLSSGDFSLLHVSDDGEVRTVEGAQVSETGAEFVAEEFSIYVVTSAGDKTPDEAMTINGQAVPNSPENPYIVGVGQTITIKGYTSHNPDSYQGYLFESDGSSSCLTKSNTSNEQVDWNSWKHQADYTATAPGTAQISIDSGEGANPRYCSVYIRVVDNAVYIMDGGNRVLLQDYTIHSNVGDSFTLSVNGTNAHLIAPKQGENYNDPYDFSDLLYRGDPYYINGNTYVTFTCKGQGTQQDIMVNGQNITAEISNNSSNLYIIENNSRNQIDESITINAFVGDSFTLSVDGYSNHLLHPEGVSHYGDTYEFNNGLLRRNDPNPDGYGSSVVNGATVQSTSVTFDCLQAGRTSYKVNGKTINVVITPRDQIYVNTALGLKHKDELHEYLADIHMWKPDNEFVYDEHGIPKYIRNGPGDNAYRVSSNEEIEVFSTIPWSDYYSGVRFYSGDNNISLIPGSDSIVSADGDFVTITAKFQVTNNPGTADVNTSIQLGTQGQNPKDTLYVIVSGDSGDANIKTHADIEIEDGGSYIIEDYSFDDDGNLIKTITEYSAAVSEVHSCKIYDRNGEQLRFLQDYEEVPEQYQNVGKPVEYINTDDHKDYYQHGSLDEPSQYEYTSNYVLNYEESQERWFSHTFLKDDGTYETVYLRGNKRFSLADSYRADFVVDLHLNSRRQTVETYGADGQLLTKTVDDDYKGYNVPESLEEAFKKKTFTLGRQDIVDAYNKCPAHSGLDFTLTSDAVMINFKMKKDFVGGDLTQKQFTFKLIDMDNPDQSYEKTFVTDDKGVIQFENIIFNSPGTYHYKVQEVSDPKDPDIIYAEDREITIQVNEVAGKLVATIEESIAQPIKNYQTFRLPDTGGRGTLPYALGGGALMGTAIMLYLRKRKEEG